MHIGKQIVLMIGGIFMAGVVIGILETIGHSVPGLSPYSAAIVGYVTGAFSGAYLIARLGGRQLLCLLLFTVLTGLAGYNVIAFPHPGWFVPAAILALAGGTYGGMQFGRRK